MRGGRVLALLALTVACNRGAEDLPEWTPADHKEAENANPAAAMPPQGPTAQQPDDEGAMPPMLQQGGELGLAFMAWRKECVRCHGPRGQGDGPESPMVHAPDLTRASFQNDATDEEIADIIRKGRGKMPAFGRELGPNVVDGLVKLIRKMRADQP